jgi:hypothetical protein
MPPQRPRRTNTTHQASVLADRTGHTSARLGGWTAPLLPMRFTAVLFYQGESNSLAGCPGAYSCLFPALIRDWRRAFGNDDLGFFFVQLASYAWHDYTHLRQAQLAALQLPTVGFATAIDLGDMHSPHGGIHPRLKQEVGRRLSLVVRAIQHLEGSGSGSGSGGTVVQHEGPRLEGVVLTNRQATAATLTFAASTAQSLHLSGTSECVDCCAQRRPSRGIGRFRSRLRTAAGWASRPMCTATPCFCLRP